MSHWGLSVKPFKTAPSTFLHNLLDTVGAGSKQLVHRCAMCLFSTPHSVIPSRRLKSAWVGASTPRKLANRISLCYFSAFHSKIPLYSGHHQRAPRLLPQFPNWSLPLTSVFDHMIYPSHSHRTLCLKKELGTFNSASVAHHFLRNKVQTQ